MSDSLQPHGLQHARLPCPSPTLGACSNSCPLSRWCHPTTSSSVIPFPSCLQSFPVSGSFQMSHLFTSGGQSIGVSAPASVLPMNIQDWSPLEWTGWISLQSKSLLQHHSSKASILKCSAFFMVQLSHPSSWWCHPTISSSAIPFSSYLQSFPASGSFLMSQLFTLGGQRSFIFGISPSNEYSELISFRIQWFDLLVVQGTLKSLLLHHN